jgi:peptide/nickel transport system permease protein
MQKYLSSPLGQSLLALVRPFTVNRKVTVGLVVVLFFVVMALFGPLFIHVDPNAPGNDLLQAPSPTHILGTTWIGQDVLAQVVYGARISLLVGFGAGIITTIISVFMGLISGYSHCSQISFSSYPPCL